MQILGMTKAFLKWDLTSSFMIHTFIENVPAGVRAHSCLYPRPTPGTPDSGSKISQQVPTQHMQIIEPFRFMWKNGLRCPPGPKREEHPTQASLGTVPPAHVTVSPTDFGPLEGQEHQGRT